MEKIPLLVATRNAGKVTEILHALSDSNYAVIGLDAAGIPRDFLVEEPASTMEGNAIIKAMVYGRRAGMLTLAEDAGLEVDALDGAPGIHSARYVPGSDEDRYRHLLAVMADVPDEQRGAQFRAVIALYDPAREKIRTCEGVYRGRILRGPKGTHGFGYDPVFFDTTQGCALAEMTPAQKDAVSHRGQAVRQAKRILAQEFIT